MRYRADIDGLRAIAILPVVLYHLDVAWMRGGFVGVDVFFVISGYLITSLLYEELEAGRYGVARFYERRIRRLLPALATVLFATAIAAYTVLLPRDLVAFAKSAIAATLFVSNVYFFEEVGYFDTEAHFKPLLHTWSLAVEEQFYIVFPLVLWAVWRWAPRRLPAVLGALAVASFCLSQWLGMHFPDAAFYLAPSRFWELLCGALLAVVRPTRPADPTGRSVMAGVGLAMIGVAVGSRWGAQAGVSAILPCLGTVLVIHGTAAGGIGARVLGSRPLVVTGLVSYPLYLWHWPIIALAQYAQAHALSAGQRLSIGLGSMALALLTWQLVERPFRERRVLPSSGPLFVAAATAAVIALVGAGVVIVEKGIPSRLPAEVAALYAPEADDGRWENCAVDIEGKPGPSMADVRSGRLCTVGPDNGTAPRFLIWGDSHARAMAPGLDEAATRLGVRGLLLSGVSCPPTIGFLGLGERGDRVARCREAQSAALDLLKAGSISLVFLVARWPKYVLGGELPNEGPFFDPNVPYEIHDRSAEVEAALDATLEALTGLGVRAALVIDVPEVGYDVPYARARAALQHSRADLAPPLTRVRARQARATEILRRMAAKHGAVIVDPIPLLCGTTTCPIERAGRLLYVDEDHLSTFGARSISGLFDVPLKMGLR